MLPLHTGLSLGGFRNQACSVLIAFQGAYSLVGLEAVSFWSCWGGNLERCRVWWHCSIPRRGFASEALFELVCHGA